MMDEKIYDLANCQFQNKNKKKTSQTCQSCQLYINAANCNVLPLMQ